MVAVASGDGLRSLFEGLGALVVDGGPTLNPPTKDLLAAIESCLADEVVLLPNSGNVLMAAEEAARLAGEAGRVIGWSRPSRSRRRSRPWSSSSPRDDAATNARRLEAGLASVRVGAVAPAARDDAEGRFRRGDSVGFAEDELVAWGGAGSTLVATVAALAETPRSSP